MNNPSEPHQLPLQLPLEPGQGRSDLVVSSSNQAAVSFLDSWPAWPNPVAILAGPTGSGKTHLAKIWAEQAGASYIGSNQLDGSLSFGGESLVIEDVEAGLFDQSSLFHAINAARQNNRFMLLTSRFWPGDWAVDLPDLASRLKIAHLMELNEPDDQLLSGVLLKLFADRQMIVEKQVIDYLVVRMERSLACALDVVEKTDNLSLSQQRRVTKPLVADVLQQIGILQ